jgi:hypothetical protein
MPMADTRHIADIDSFHAAADAADWSFSFSGFHFLHCHATLLPM